MLIRNKRQSPNLPETRSGLVRRLFIGLQPGPPSNQVITPLMASGFDDGKNQKRARGFH